MKVFGWLADLGGCAWYRMLVPLVALRELHGVQVHWSNNLYRMDEDTDILVAQRVCKPGPTKLLQKVARAPNRPKIVMELDDDLIHVDQYNHPKATEFFNDPQIKSNLIDNLRVADLVTVSTEPLAAVMRRFNDNIAVLPNSIPSEMLTWVPGHYTSRFTVGWSGSATHERDWTVASAEVERWFNAAKRDGLAVEMHTIGDLPKTFPSVYPHRVSDWCEDVISFYRMVDWHVSLAPLADTRFNRSKSAIRALEAAMLGLPVIASDVDAYREVVRHGETGFLIKRPQDWGKHLTMLAADQQARHEMSRNAKLEAGKYAIEKHAIKWLETYRDLGVATDPQPAEGASRVGP